MRAQLASIAERELLGGIQKGYRYNGVMRRGEQLIPCVPGPNRRGQRANVLFVRMNKW